MSELLDVPLSLAYKIQNLQMASFPTFPSVYLSLVHPTTSSSIVCGNYH